MRGGDWMEFRRFGDDRPIRREPEMSAYYYALGVVRDRHGLRPNETLPPGTYMVDAGDGAVVIEIARDGGLTFGFDTACPPTSEWAGTPADPSEKPPPAG